MGYQIEFSSNAKKEMDRLPKEIAIRILKKVREIEEEPFRFLKRLVGCSLFSLRVGDYRVILLEYKQTLVVTRVGHRKEVYDF